LRRLRPILLLLACTGVLQTALAAASADSSRDCLNSVASSPADLADCSHPDGTDNNPRQPLRSLANSDTPPKLKGLNAYGPDISRSWQTNDDCGARLAQNSPPAEPLYLITRRIRI
jgi:hypothetical protein